MPPQVEAVTAEESAAGIGSWMKDLPSIKDTGTPTPEAKKEEPAKVPPSDASAVDLKTTAATTSGLDKGESATNATHDAAKLTKPAAESAKADGGEEDDKIPRTGADWDKFKAKRKERETKLQAEIKERETKLAEYDAKVKALETEFTSLKEKAGTPNHESQAEVERLRKELEDYSNRLAVSEVTSHPKFIAYFKGRTDEQIAEIKEVVGPELADAVTAAIALPDGDYKNLKIEEIYADLSPMQQNNFSLNLRELKKIERERQAEIAKAGESRSKLQAEQKTNAEQRIAKNKQLFGNVLKSLQDPKDGMAIYQLRDGDEAWNSQVKETITRAEKILFGTPDQKPEDIARESLNAAAFPTLLKAYQGDMKERDDKIAKLEAQVKELSAAQPAATSNGAAAAAGAGAGDASAAMKRGVTSPMEASAAWVRGLRNQE